MSSWYASETDIHVWYKRVHVVRYQIPFVDEELQQLEEYESNDARFIELMDKHQSIREIFALNVGTRMQRPDFYIRFENFISWNEEPYAQFHNGIVNYCQFALKQHYRFKNNLRLIVSISERQRVLVAVTRYLRNASVYTHPFASVCSILEFWHAEVERALAENGDVDLEVGLLVIVSGGNEVAMDCSVSAPRRWASMGTHGANLAMVEKSDLSACGQGLTLSDWYKGLQIVCYDLTFANELVDENLWSLEALIKKDESLQAFFNANRQELDWFTREVEKCKCQGRSWPFVSLGYGEGMGRDSRRPMLHRGLVNYCRFAVKQHACFKENVHHIASHSERLRVQAKTRSFLENAQTYVDPFYNIDTVLRTWHETVTTAIAEDVITGFEGPMWIEEDAV